MMQYYYTFPLWYYEAGRHETCVANTFFLQYCMEGIKYTFMIHFSAILCDRVSLHLVYTLFCKTVRHSATPILWYIFLKYCLARCHSNIIVICSKIISGKEQLQCYDTLYLNTVWKKWHSNIIVHCSEILSGKAPPQYDESLFCDTVKPWLPNDPAADTRVLSDAPLTSLDPPWPNTRCPPNYWPVEEKKLWKNIYEKIWGLGSFL